MRTKMNIKIISKWKNERKSNSFYSFDAAPNSGIEITFGVPISNNNQHIRYSKFECFPISKQKQ